MAIIQVRGVSAKAHRRLKTKAGKAGQSLSEYLRVELEDLANQQSLEEALARVASREPVDGGGAAATIRAEREKRDRQLADR